MKIDVVYERDVRWSKWPWLNRILGIWYLIASFLVFFLCLPPLVVGLLMTGRAAGTLLKRVGVIYERLIV